MDKKLTVAELLRSALMEQVEINPKQPVVSYVRARHLIDQCAPNREWRREAKMVVIEHLKGKKKPPKLNKNGIVVEASRVWFKLPDGTERSAAF